VLPVTSRKSELQWNACAPGIKRPNRPPNGRPKGATLASTAGLGVRGLFLVRAAVENQILSQMLSVSLF
jgi:hypothetical protein